MDLGELLQQNLGRAYGLAYRITGNEDESADIVQEASMKALVKAGLFDESRPFWPWFARIVHNVTMDRFRRQAKFESLEDHEPIETKTPAVTSDQKDIQRQVQIGLAKLEPENRMAVVLVDLQGMTYEEAAGIMKCPVSTVGVRLHRARKILQEELVGILEGEV